jgi:hypothetical protein
MVVSSRKDDAKKNKSIKYKSGQCHAEDILSLGDIVVTVFEVHIIHLLIIFGYEPIIRGTSIHSCPMVIGSLILYCWKN